MYISAHHLGGLAGGLLALAALWPLLHFTPLGRAWAARDLPTRVASTLLLVAAGIHLGLLVGHSVDRATGWLFVLNGAAFAACFVAVFIVRWWRWPAGLLLVATIAAYLVYLSSGREEADEVGIISKMLELLALGLVLAPHGRRRRRLRWGLGAAALLGLTLVSGTAAYAAELRPGAGHVHGGPAYPTPAQVAGADQLVRDTSVGIARFQDPKIALAEGYKPDGLKTPTSHWSNSRYLQDRYVLDPYHPQTLVYANTRHGPVLLGAMYMMPRVGETGPQPGGPLTVWHTHDNICISVAGFFIAGFESPFGACPVTTFSIRTQQMMHVWTAPNPKGPIADLDEKWAAEIARS